MGDTDNMRRTKWIWRINIKDQGIGREEHIVGTSSTMYVTVTGYEME